MNYSIAKIIFAIILTSLLVGCADEKSAEELFKQTLTEMEESAQQRDIDALMDHVSPDYRDSAGRTREDIRKIAQIQFLRNRKLHIYKHVTQLDMVDETFAEVIVLVAIAGQPIESVDALNSLRAELMQFKVRFQFDNRWLMQSAEWGRAGISDFLQ
jgi:hypothetical protein